MLPITAAASPEALMSSSDIKPLPHLPSSLIPGSTLRKRSQSRRDTPGEDGSPASAQPQDDPPRAGTSHAAESSNNAPAGDLSLAKAQNRLSGVSLLSFLPNPFSPRHDAFANRHSQHELDAKRRLSDEHPPTRDDGFSTVPLTPLLGSESSRTPPLPQQPARPSFAPRIPTPDFDRVSRPLRDAWDYLSSRPSSLGIPSPPMLAKSLSQDSHDSRVTIAPTVSSSGSSPTLSAQEDIGQWDLSPLAHLRPSAPAPLPPSPPASPHPPATQMPSVAMHLAHKFPLPKVLPECMQTDGWLGIQGVALWAWSKWVLLLSVITVFAYGIVGFTLILLTWFGAFERADVFAATNEDILVFVLSATLLILVTSLLGLTGTLLNSRPILAFYAILLFPSFVALLIPAYTAYKRASFNLDGKLNLGWSEWWDDQAKLVIQNSLRCCGYYSPLHQAVFSKRCYPRVPLPVGGCKAALLQYETWALRRTYVALFALVPAHLINMIIALLCANHVTDTFGQGLTPMNHRITGHDVDGNAKLAQSLINAQREFSLVRRPPTLQTHSMERHDTRIAWGSRAKRASGRSDASGLSARPRWGESF